MKFESIISDHVLLIVFEMLIFWDGIPRQMQFNFCAVLENLAPTFLFHIRSLLSILYEVMNILKISNSNLSNY